MIIVLVVVAGVLGVTVAIMDVVNVVAVLHRVVAAVWAVHMLVVAAVLPMLHARRHRQASSIGSRRRR